MSSMTYQITRIRKARPSEQQLQLRVGELEARLRSVELDLERERAQRQAAEKLTEKLRVDAVTDGLTGLPNRRALLETLERDVAQAARHGVPISVLVIDADHFKRINDTYGHPVGDAVLRSVAEAIASSLRAGDFVARFGGEEFVVVLPFTEARGGHVVAERVRHAVALATIDDETVPSVTVSVGGTTLREDESRSVSELLGRADAALYRAKDAGRDCVRCHGVDDKG